MNLLLELALDTIATGGVTAGLMLAKSKLSKKRFAANAWGAVPWLYKKARDGSWGFYCPKCINIHKNKGQPPHCMCDEYHVGHFHFKCGDCGYTAIMRTADDK